MIRRLVQLWPLIPWFRVIVSALGLAGVVAGAVIAWNAKAATPLLIVSGVLVALGLYDWTEITLRHGEWSGTLKRVADRIGGVAARDDVPEEAREQLEAAAGELAGVTGAAGSAYGWREALVGIVAKPSATLVQVQNELLAEFAPTTVYAVATPTVQCHISTPSGGHFSSDVRLWGPFGVWFPRDFEHAPTLQAGEYVASWTQQFREDRPALVVAEAKCRVP
jgi:hypothetical protein